MRFLFPGILLLSTFLFSFICTNWPIISVPSPDVEPKTGLIQSEAELAIDLLRNATEWEPCMAWLEEGQSWTETEGKLEIRNMELCRWIPLVGQRQVHLCVAGDTVHVTMTLVGIGQWSAETSGMVGTSLTCWSARAARPLLGVNIALASLTPTTTGVVSTVTVSVISLNQFTTTSVPLLSHSGDVRKTFSAPVVRGVGVPPLPSLDIPNGGVTLVTHLSMDRLPRVALQAVRWDGPVAAALWLQPWELPAFATALRRLPSLRRIHWQLVWGSGEYPVNLLRNLAANKAPTEWRFLVDCDFIPGGSLGSWWKEQAELDEKSVFVIPALQLDGTVPFPQSKEAIRRLWRNGQASQTHQELHAPSHAAVDYPRWVETSVPYRIEYQQWFEPYVVAPQNLPQ